MDGLRGVLWHATDAWARRRQPNIVLAHYDDLLGDLPGEMRRLAQRLDIDVPARRLQQLVEAASFEGMRARSDRVAPSPGGILKDSGAFVRRGRSGAGAQVLTSAHCRHYLARGGEIAPEPVLRWLHHEPPRTSPSR